MQKKSIRDVEVEGRRALVRVDFNVPLEKGQITDDTRIVAALPTINYLRERGARVILMSHLGRPQDKDKSEWGQLTLDPVAKRLSELLGVNVAKTDDCIGPEVTAAVKKLKNGDVLLLENTRFHPEEEKNNLNFARKLAALGDLFVNDAFGAAHRAHASTVGVTNYLSPCVIGFLMEKELQVLREVLTAPERPLVVILGGKKVSDKIGVVKNLLRIADRILIGGGMAYTFLKAQGREVGKSILDDQISLDEVRAVMQQAEEKGVELLLPVDVVVGQEFTPDTKKKTVTVEKIPADWEGLDIGPQTRARFIEALQDAGMVVWNGPLGVFEFDAFAQGTNEVAQALAQSSAKAIIGGGDSAAAVLKAGVADRMYHLCTGGGASLEFLEGKELPGVAVLDNVRTPVAAANWKMNLTVAEARKFLKTFKPAVAEVKDVEILLCPTFTTLPAVANAVKGTNLKVGAQDLFWKESGAYTGEVSAAMLKEAGATHVIVGHSERRRRFGVPEPELAGDLGAVFGDNDATVNAKLRAALAQGLIPILCVGETLAERQQGTTDDVIRLQLKRALHGVPAEQAAGLILAYEPVWAIGTGETCDAKEADRVIGNIRAIVAELYGEDVARQVRLLYGGSVKPDNIAGLMAQPHIDGGLVGGASLKPDSFAAIVAGCR